MLQPTDRPPTSRAPRLAASISPGPPPVMHREAELADAASDLARDLVVRMRLRETAPTRRSSRTGRRSAAPEPADEVAHGPRRASASRARASAGLRAGPDRTCRRAPGRPRSTRGLSRVPAPGRRIGQPFGRARRARHRWTLGRTSALAVGWSWIEQRLAPAVAVRARRARDDAGGPATAVQNSMRSGTTR